jgi:uridine kinase
MVPGPKASGLAKAASVIVAEVRRSVRDRQGGGPMLIALDGGSGSGKSTLAALVAADVDAAIVDSDDFFAGEITDAEWAAMGPRERAAAAIDWRRLRREALEPLLAGKTALWHPFDFAAGTRPDGTYPMSREAVTRGPASVIILDGAYSARPEISDLIDLAVLVDVPTSERHRRIAIRETDEAFLAAWHARWDAAEDYYFTHVRPPSSFDLVVAIST